MLVEGGCLTLELAEEVFTLIACCAGGFDDAGLESIESDPLPRTPWATSTPSSAVMCSAKVSS